MRNLLWLSLIPVTLLAQPTIAPSPEPVGNPRGENVGAYNWTNSWEAGYRWRSVDGNLGKYRSDVNFGNGLRLLGSQLRVNSREGQGRYFDELMINTQGLGNDPYESAQLRIEKNGLYRYDLHWRWNDYFNPALTIANGQHFMNTRRTFQDHDITLLPQSPVRLFLGYTRNRQEGPALTTVQLFDSRGDEFPLFFDVNRRRSEFRLGGEADLLGFKLNVLHVWDAFREDSPIYRPIPGPGNNELDNTTLTSLQRTEPYEGNSPYWRLTLFRNARKYAINARYVNVSGSRDFLFDETAIGTDRLGAARNRQVVIAGSGRRPVVSGSLNLSWLPTDRLTLTNHTSFHNTRIDGNATYRELNNAFQGDAIRDFQFLGIRSIQTLTDATVAVSKWASLYGGYHFSTRRIRSVEGQTFGEFTDVIRAEQDNQLHSGLTGLRLRPVKPLVLQLDAELGRANQPIYPISEKKYHALNARLQYRARSFAITGLTRTLYNTNSTNLFAHSSRSRQYAADFSWTQSSRISLDAGYSKLHLDTATGIAYFAASALVQDRSLYFSNMHTGNFGMRVAASKRVDLFVGYTIVKDTGDGRSSLAAPSLRADQVAFYQAQTFPLSYQSPHGRLSIRLRENLRWNAGYQFYGYREKFFQLTNQNYRAHTGFTSLLWSF
jgi:hypothetical protein